MNSIKDISPCFDKVTSVTDTKEFVQTFCLKALKLLEEFKAAYRLAIENKKIDELDSITHKIASTMNWLELDEFVTMTRAYKDFPSFDKKRYDELLEKVMHYSNMIENSIRSKLDDV